MDDDHHSQAVPGTMSAMVLTGHGGVDKLVHRDDVPVPRPAPGQVLVRVTATAKNNTDRKAREGLYPTKDEGRGGVLSDGWFGHAHLPPYSGRRRGRAGCRGR